MNVEAFRLFCSDARDIFLGSEASKGLQATAVIVGVDEEPEVLTQLVVIVVVVTFDRGILDRTLHLVDLAVRPRMIGLVEPVFDAMLVADLVEAVDSHLSSPAIAITRQVGELDAVIG